MRELARKMALASLGTAVVSTAKVRETMQTLVQQGKLTTEEAERFTHQMCETGEKEMKDMKQHLNEGLERVTKGMHLAQAEEVEQLRHRVDNLEKRLSLLEDQLTPTPASAGPAFPEQEPSDPDGE
jgi:polyhydroxyalkanoate synthesis regulator phasin